MAAGLILIGCVVTFTGVKACLGVADDGAALSFSVLFAGSGIALLARGASVLYTRAIQCARR